MARKMLDDVRDRYVYGGVNWVDGAGLDRREAAFDEWYAALLPNESELAGWIAEGYEPGAQPLGTHNRHDKRAAEYVLTKMCERMGIVR